MKINKNWALLGAALLLAIGVSFMRSAKADQRNVIPAVVVLDGREIYQGAYPVAFVIETSSSSPGAPVFKPGDDLSTALAMLRDQGFQITVHSYGWLTYTAIR